MRTIPAAGAFVRSDLAAKPERKVRPVRPWHARPA